MKMSAVMAAQGQLLFFDQIMDIYALDWGWDRRCELCVAQLNHTYLAHDIFLDRRIKPERRAQVLAFRRNLYSISRQEIPF